MRRTILTLTLVLAASGLSLTAQTTPAPSTATQTVYANLNQLMRGVLYPAANVVFSPQFENPANVKQDLDPSMSTDPLKATFGGWQAIENAALALAESTNLLLVPGRLCSTGVSAPVTDPDWVKYVNEVRDAAMQAYKAGQAKDQDKLIELSETVSGSCEHCHRKWRNRRAPAIRCK
jgi:hypothetical protein